MLNIRFHYGGEFIRIGPSLDYVGGDTAMLDIVLNLGERSTCRQRPALVQLLA